MRERNQRLRADWRQRWLPRITGYLALLVTFFVLLANYLPARPPVLSEPSPNAHFLERCKRFCQERGLMVTGHLANDAQAYLRRVKNPILGIALAKLLDDPQFTPRSSHPHPLLGKEPPPFQLSNHQGKKVSLARQVDEGPVVIVFYYGYHCNHCVAQLFGIQEDLARFRELGTTVLAISPDPPEITATRYAQYGAFGFEVLSDPDHEIAMRYGVYQPTGGEQPEALLHGTFVIGLDGNIRWCNRDVVPFVDNQTLLWEIARGVGLKP